MFYCYFTLKPLSFLSPLSLLSKDSQGFSLLSKLPQILELGVWIRRTCRIFKSLCKTGRGERRVVLSGFGEMMVCS
ncbi:hypothetical protein HAX54_001001 [Datura stramonium]|uniref:Uncharacterized protein n=1 Tax=Datura stramonium TaxID=4076 RepID=A0ABS8WVA8_DATST|nr:hypothetical protein [Datura stramonium]